MNVSSPPCVLCGAESTGLALSPVVEGVDRVILPSCEKCGDRAVALAFSIVHGEAANIAEKRTLH